MERIEIGHRKASQFEDLIAWKKARELAGKIYKISRMGRFVSDDLGYLEKDSFEDLLVPRSVSSSDNSNLSSPHALSGDPLDSRFRGNDKSHSNLVNSILALGQELGRIIGGLRASVQRQRDHNRGKQ